MRQRHIPLRVEVEHEILAGDHLFAHEHTLPGIDAAELTRLEQAALHDEALGGEVLEDDEVVVAVGEQSVLRREVA